MEEIAKAQLKSWDSAINNLAHLQNEVAKRQQEQIDRLWNTQNEEFLATHFGL